MGRNGWGASKTSPEWPNSEGPTPYGHAFHHPPSRVQGLGFRVLDVGLVHYHVYPETPVSSIPLRIKEYSVNHTRNAFLLEGILLS